jgi:hypothetical protein
LFREREVSTVPSSSSYDSEGSFADVLSHANRLVRSPDDGGTLVVSVVGGEAFVQFAGGPGGVQWDFPVVTKDQRALEGAFRAYCGQHGLAIADRYDEGAQQYLDVDLPADASRIAQIVHDALTGIMGVDPSARLTFLGESVGPA